MQGVAQALDGKAGEGRHLGYGEGALIAVGQVFEVVDEVIVTVNHRFESGAFCIEFVPGKCGLEYRIAAKGDDAAEKVGGRPHRGNEGKGVVHVFIADVAGDILEGIAAHLFEHRVQTIVVRVPVGEGVFGDVIGKQRFAGAEGLRRQLHDRDTLSSFLKELFARGKLEFDFLDFHGTPHR